MEDYNLEIRRVGPLDSLSVGVIALRLLTRLHALICFQPGKGRRSNVRLVRFIGRLF